MSKYADIAGKTFGKLTAIEPIVKHTNGKKHTLWVFRCSCGKLTERPPHRVASGWVSSCGCSVTSADQRYFGEQSVAYNVYYVSYSDGNLTFDAFLKLSKQNCHYCGAEPGNCRIGRKNANDEAFMFVYNGLDRLNNNLPHDVNNVVPCCIDCNQMKSFRNVDQFLERVAVIYKHKILNRS